MGVFESEGPQLVAVGVVCPALYSRLPPISLLCLLHLCDANSCSVHRHHQSSTVDWSKMEACPKVLFKVCFFFLILKTGLVINLGITSYRY